MSERKKWYLKVHIEGPHIGDDHTRYEELEDHDLEPWSESELLSRGQDIVNEVYTWGHSVVPEEDVPEGER